MHQVLRFWLDRGVDGFRADVIHCIGKDPDLPDDPPAVAGIPHCGLNDVPVTHHRLRAIRALLDGYDGDRVVVGEVYLLSTDAVATYYGEGDELHLSFNFPPLYARWSEDQWTACIAATTAALDPRGAWPTWVLSNHDNVRHRGRYVHQAARAGADPTTAEQRSEAMARAAAVLLLDPAGHPLPLPGRGVGTARTRSFRRSEWWTPGAGTGVGHRSRGTALPTTAGPPSTIPDRGCPSPRNQPIEITPT